MLSLAFSDFPLSSGLVELGDASLLLFCLLSGRFSNDGAGEELTPQVLSGSTAFFSSQNCFNINFSIQ